MKKKLYTVNWDIVKLSAMVSKLPPMAKLTPAMYARIYTGNGTRLFGDPKRRNWGMTIITEAVDPEGGKHTLEMNYKPTHPLFLSEAIQETEQDWRRENNEVLKDCKIVSALVTANCLV